MTTANDVIGFVQAWHTANGIAATQAQKEQFAKALNAEIAKVPALYEHQSQAQMIAYSGSLSNSGGTVHAFQVAKELSAIDNTQNFYISDTPRGWLLSRDNVEFQEALKSVLPNDADFNRLFNGDTNTTYSFGEELALNDFISKGLIEANPVKRNFAPLIGDGVNASKVLIRTEFEAVLKTEPDSGYTHIYGIPKEHWKSVLDVEGQEAFISKLTTASTNYRVVTGLEFEVGTDANGHVIVTSLNAGEFLDEASTDILTDFDNKQAVERLNNYWNSLDESGKLDYEARQQAFRDTAIRLANDGLTYDVNKFGQASDSISFIYAGHRSSKLAAAGDQAGASAIMKEWGDQFTSGELGANKLPEIFYKLEFSADITDFERVRGSSFTKNLGDDAAAIIARMSEQRLLGSGLIASDGTIDFSRMDAYLDRGMDNYVKQQLIMTGVLNANGQYDANFKSAYLSGAIDDIDTYLADNPEAARRYLNYLDGLDEQGKLDFLAKKQQLRELAKGFADNGLAYEANKLGKASDSLDFLYAAHRASAAADQAGATAIMKEWGNQFTSGELGANKLPEIFYKLEFSADITDFGRVRGSSFTKNLGDDAAAIIARMSEQRLLGSGLIASDGTIDFSRMDAYLDRGMDNYVKQQLIMTGVLDANGNYDANFKNAYLSGSIAEIDTYLADNPKAVDRIQQYFNALDLAGRQNIYEGQDALKNLGSADGHLPYHLNNLGIAADVFEFIIIGTTAAQLAMSGNEAQATKMLKDWALETLAGAGGGVIGGRLASATLGEIASAVFGIASSATPFGWLGKALVYGAAFAGGYIASDNVDEFFDLFDDQDENTHLDIIDKLSNILFGATTTLNGVTIPADGGDLGFTADMSREDMVELAQDDIAYRYALREMNPFALFGADYEAVHNQDGSLDLYDEETGEGSMTLSYLRDRAAMLTWKIRYDTGMQDDDDAPHDGVKPYNEEWDTSTVNGNWDFVDMTIRIPGGAPLTLAIDGVNTTLNDTLYDHQIVFGSKNNDSFNGSGDIDHLYGMAGNDVINADDGNDWVEGGLGNDTLMGGDEDDQVFGGAGNDRIFGDDDSISDIYWAGNDTLHGGDGDDVIMGEAGFDKLHGDGGNDRLYGEDDSDVLYGGAGHDILSGGDDNDTLYGGMGHDIYAFESGIFSGDGIDTVIDEDGVGDIYLNKFLTGGSNYRGNNLWIDTPGTGSTASTYYRMNGNTLTINDYYGNTKIHVQNFNNGQLNITLGGGQQGTTADDYLWGNAGNNVLDGGAGNDVLNGGKGADTMKGGTGNDTYIADSSDDIAEETDAGPTGGNDKVQSSADYELGDNVENLDLLGDEAIDGTGNDLNNIINGNSGDNVLDGSGGDDVLNGGAGADVLIGGDGNDSYVVDSEADLINEANADLLSGGNDSVQAYVSYSLGANIENLTLIGTASINGTGNEANNTLLGNAAINVLDGGAGDDLLNAGAGADVMLGGIGNDTYVVDNLGDQVSEDADSGVDIVQSTVTFSLSSNLENLTLTGTAAINAMGNTLNNILLGNTAANLLDGGSGADEMAGGAGNDVYVVDDVADVVIEALNAGTDTVQTSLDYVLGANLENLTLLGSEALSAVGNAVNNTLTGNSANNVLDGGAGNDALLGGLGDDTYIVDSTLDVITEGLEAGVDNIVSNVTFTASANVENLTLTGMSAINATGNLLNNVLVGNSAANIISGGLGDDTMQGGNGNDIYVVDSADDVITENNDEGLDTVQSSVSYALSDNIESIALTGALAIDAVGNALNNALTGNAANNILDGGDGADAMAGAAGNDIYIVDNTLDVVTEAANAGTDTVHSSVTYTASANVENLTLTGENAINALGNTLNNVLIGNSANNVLDAGAGNDTLDGGLGADTMLGGAGNDLYIVDDSSDVVTEAASAGTDTIQSSITYTASTNVENLTLTGTEAINGTGNALNNTLLGNTGNNVLDAGAGIDILDGGLGDDTMIGGAGNDTYVVDSSSDVVIETDSVATTGGVDLVQASASFVLGANIENITLTGTGSIDGTGNALNNTMIGNAANNVLDGGAGNDTFTGGGGDDTFIGGAGNDTYTVDSIADAIIETDANISTGGTDIVNASVSYTLSANIENLTLTGTTAINGIGNDSNNILLGNAANNVLDGGAGNDTLNGGAGADTMQGGAGDDMYVVDNIADLVTENADEGNDTVQSSVTNTLGSNLENLTLTGTAAINATGNALNNTLTGNAAANILDGGLGADQMIGGAGNDTYVVDDIADVITEALNAGTDNVQTSLTYTLGANLENLTLTGEDSINGTGNALNNTLLGNIGNNVLDAGSGVDTLNGGLGDDTMIGGAGNDTYVVDSSSDVVIETDSVSTTGGVDLVQASASFALSANVENITLTGAASIDGTGNALNNIMTGNAGNNVLDGGAGNDTFTGGSGDDTFIGGDGNDIYTVDSVSDVIIEANSNLAIGGSDLVNSSVSYTLSANVENLTLTGTAAINGAGNDANNILLGNTAVNQLDGGAGNDTLNGGAGSDTLFGGTGDDIYIVDNVADTVTELADEGNDTVQSSITYSLGNHLENLTLTGTAAINGSGNALNNILTGNAAANVLDGGLGADQLIGGAGNDTYVIDDVADTVTEALNAGTDTVQTALAYTLGGNLENLTLTGTDSVNGTGNALNNTLLGNAANNVLDAGAGVDILNGGLGDDTMIGGAGNDTYVVDSSSDVVIETDAVPTTGGVDLVQTSASFGLSANVENLTLTGTASINGTGNDLANVLSGNASNNVLDGGAGNDTLTGGGGDDTFIGGAGNDTYTVDGAGDVIVEVDANLATGGLDTVSASVSFALSENVENLTLTGTTSINGVGNAGNNTLIGNTAINILDGGAGNDTLNGGAGADAMLGGAGDDIYVVDNVADVVTEGVDAGNDTVQSSITFALGSDLENLTLTGTSAINGTGNALNNVLTGNAAANTLNGGLGDDIIDGGAGNDNMIGGIGNDSYYVNVATDIVTENADEGTDTVFSAATYTLGANLENLTLTGTAAINGTGNTFDNVLTGNAAANILNGGVGADTMMGGAGNDTYVVDHQSDLVIEDLGAGTDTVQTELSYTLGDHLENLTLTGATVANGTGNSLNNTITGNTANNVLNGGAGNDTMAGGAGDDTYVVDSMLDVVIEAANAGTDTISSSVTYTLSANVENLTLSGSENINATGNALNNTLIGNSANNLMNGATGTDWMLGGAGDDIYTVDNIGDVVSENVGEGIDTVQSAVTFTLGENLEHLTLTGAIVINGTGNNLDNALTGNTVNNVLNGGLGDDTLDGGAGNDNMIGGEGNDRYVVNVATDIVTELENQGFDSVTSIASFTLSAHVESLILAGTLAINAIGNDLSNYLLGNAANNILTDTLGGNDVLQGLAGNDIFNDLIGNNLLDGGVGIDVLTIGNGNDLLIGGIGNDTLTTGAGFDVISFNKGDGQDLINASSGTDNTLSVGGVFDYSELSLSKSANNLIVKVGGTDQITIKDWYLGATNKSVANLQVIAEAVTGFVQGGTDQLRNNKVENFNFASLVAAFDADGATANWQLTDTRLTAHLLAGSDTAAIGGDLAYQYGRNGNLTGMGLIAAQNVINATNFGQTAQTLNAPSTWSTELVKLA